MKWKKKTILSKQKMKETLKKIDLEGKILLQAYTNSDWDSCDTFVMDQDVEWLKLLLLRMDHAAYFESKAQIEGGLYAGFDHIVYNDLTGDFLDIMEGKWSCNEAESGEQEEFLLVDTSISLERISEDIELCEPENNIGDHIVKVSFDHVIFSAYGKHTGEEFWTSLLTRSSIEKIINQLENSCKTVD
jgi:hypothetical protein